MTITIDQMQYARDRAKKALRIDPSVARLCDPVAVPVVFKDLESYYGDFAAYSRRLDGLWSGLDTLLGEYTGDDLPPFVYPCFLKRLEIEWGSVVNWVTDELNGQCSTNVDESDIVGWPELRAAFERFYAAQRDLGDWVFDTSRVIVLDEARFKAFLRGE